MLSIGGGIQAIMRHPRPAWRRYAVALLLVLAMVVIRSLMAPTIGTHSSTFLLFLPTLLSIAYGGMGPGLLAAALSTVAMDGLLLRDGLAVNSLFFRDSLFICQNLVLIWFMIGQRRLGELRHKEALFVGEQRFRAVFAQAAVGMAMSALDGRFIQTNRAYRDITGYMEEELGALDFIAITHPDDRAAITRLTTRMASGELPNFMIERRYLNKAGEIVWVHSSVSLISDAHGQPAHYISIVQDITERKQTEERLRLLAAAVQATEEGVLITDNRLESPGPRILFINEGFTRITGYAAEEVMGKSSRLLQGPKTDPEVVRQCRDAMRQGSPFIGEGIHYRKDGSEYLLEYHISPVTNDAGRITHYVGLMRDVTERRQAEAIKREHGDLRDSVTALEGVLGVVGHELRTPLAALRAMSELLLTGEVREAGETQTFLTGIHDEVIRMTGMVNDLLEVARLNSGTARWNWSEFTVTDMCRHALDSMRPLINRAKVEATLNVDPPDLKMVGDPDAVRRLVLNLLANAAKHTNEGFIRIHVRQRVEDDLPWVEIEIRDSGTGMSRQTAARLGEAFALNSGVLGESYVQGSGLGLAICKGIVAAHGGRIAVESQLHHGTTVTVMLRADLSRPVLDTGKIEIIRKCR